MVAPAQPAVVAPAQPAVVAPAQPAMARRSARGEPSFDRERGDAAAPVETPPVAPVAAPVQTLPVAPVAAPPAVDESAAAVAARYHAVGNALHARGTDPLWQQYRRIQLGEAMATATSRHAALATLDAIERALPAS